MPNQGGWETDNFFEGDVDSAEQRKAPDGWPSFTVQQNLRFLYGVINFSKIGNDFYFAVMCINNNGLLSFAAAKI